RQAIRLFENPSIPHYRVLGNDADFRQSYTPRSVIGLEVSQRLRASARLSHNDNSLSGNLTLESSTHGFQAGSRMILLSRQDRPLPTGSHNTHDGSYAVSTRLVTGRRKNNHCNV